MDMEERKRVQDAFAKDARILISTAAEKRSRLGRYFSKYGISATMSLPITDEVSAHVGPDLRGVLLGLVEVYQRQARWEDAIACDVVYQRVRLYPGGGEWL